MVGTLTGSEPHIVLAGGGHAHAVALRLLSRDKSALPAQITVVSPTTHNLYSGALPGVIAGHWPVDAIRVNLPALCEAAGVTFAEDAVADIDADGGIVQLATGRSMPFDVLSLDIGSLIRPLNVSDPGSLIVPIRPIPGFLERWISAVEDMQSGSAPASVMVVGAGLAGVEVCLAVQHRVQAALKTPAKVFLVDTSDEIAATSHPALRRKLGRALQRVGVTCISGTRLEACEDGKAILSNGQSVDVSLIVNCAGSAPHAWVGRTSLKTVGGRVEVDECLRSTSHPHIWAAGDASYYKAHPLEPAGVFAVRAGPVIAENIRHFTRDEPLSPFRPQSDYLKLVSLGGQRAIAEKFGLTFEGKWIWNLKKSIDFSFLRTHDVATRH